MEIFRIAPISRTPTGVSEVMVVTKKDTLTRTEEFKGLEIKVAMLPEELIEKCSTLQCQLTTSSSLLEMDKKGGAEFSAGKCLATWLLHQATTAIDSVFDDWYESFARKKGFDPHQENVRITNPCSKCMEHVRASTLRELQRPYPASTLRELQRPLQVSNEPQCLYPASTPRELQCPEPSSPQGLRKPLYVFTSLYAAHVTAENKENLECPEHGTLKVADVAPDLVS